MSDYPTYWVVSGGESNQVEDGPHLTMLKARIAQAQIIDELDGRLQSELQIEVRRAGL